MKIYITKYALTSGVITATLDEAQKKTLEFSGSIYIKPDGFGFKTFFYSRDIETSLEDLNEKFEEMRAKKLQSLEKQIKKYSIIKLKFDKLSKGCGNE